MLSKTELSKMMNEMAAIGAKYGVKVTPNGGSMAATDAKIKFVVNELVVSASGKVEVALTARAKAEARFEGIDLEKTFTFQGKTHRIIDFHPRKYKAPWITEASDGKSYKWPALRIKQMQGAVAVAKPTNTSDRLGANLERMAQGL